eukprot:TRINITY_DN2027_c0_g1_i4.p1 TRINITY_DN2027_c0_g1~~TRINITY_DN2027_c0_g1_i4.p1  ORF type:complete len:523 (+),score=52.65 TRINITY_DN2027_c0_g1_i4:183-1571(+)
MVFLGIIMGCCAWFFLSGRTSFFRGNDLFVQCEVFFRAPFFLGSLIALGLAPLPDSVWFARLVLAGQCLIMSTNAYRKVQWLPQILAFQHQHRCKHGTLEVSGAYCDYRLGAEIYMLARLGVYFCQAVFAMCQRKPGQIQWQMWFGLAIWGVSGCAFNVTDVIVDAISLHELSRQIWYLLWNAITFYVASNPIIRLQAQSIFRRAFRTFGATAAAAGIAALIGDSDSEEILSYGKSRFRSIRIDELAPTHMSSSAGPTLYGRSLPITYGKCDAFISHSWHDDEDAKWSAMRSWQERFVAEHGRQPTVWIDKHCIDQTNLEYDLRCLPIFISGCDRLVVLCGTTYLSRLWCIMELFTFVHMGKDMDKIDVVPVLRNHHEDEDLDTIKQALDCFDASQCTCTKVGDRDRLLSIINTAFSGINNFNRAILEIMHVNTAQTPKSIYSSLTSCDDYDIESQGALSPR